MSKAATSTTIAEATITLPEGATVRVSKLTSGKAEVRAWRGDNIVKMRCDNVSPQHLPWYLSKMVSAINRERATITKKPAMSYPSPRTIVQFVTNMAFFDMFIFHALDAPTPELVAPNEPKKKKRKSKREKDPQKEPF